MFPNLSPGAVGIRANIEEAATLARTNGFKGIDIDIHEPERYGAEKLKALLKENGLRIGGWGLPVDFGGSDEKFREGLKELPKWAAFLPQFGCNSFMSWMMSGSNEFTFAEHFERMRSRFREIGLILKDHGCVFGIEFLGPKTIRANFKHEFIHTLPQMIELCDAVGTGNMGVLLDSWHWFTSGGNLAQIRKLRPEQVVYVHINDAPKGVALDKHIDDQRAMPMETGVIDLPGFLRALNEIGYTGPVTPEPFNKALAQMPAEEAARVTAASVKKAWEAAGLGW
ncbi:MAG TPA: sugar phosphate isomerase/epimerase family protein [Candidatus Latescibacteria bacterium]|nr:sugar phosphate isomerase/epimerase family protein [Candidatus Latescibacterota bacterium]